VTPRPADSPLTWEHREVAQARIRQAARQVIIRRGLATTVEDVAREAGVSVRTVFRYYPTRDTLIAGAVREIRRLLVRPVEGLPDPAVDLDAWLLALATEVHRRLTYDLGRAFWDLRVTEPDSAETFAESRAWHRAQMQALGDVAGVAWQAAGGPGEPPDSLVCIFMLMFSAFTTQALASDFGYGPDDTASLVASTLKVLLVHAVDERTRSQPAPSSPR